MSDDTVLRPEDVTPETNPNDIAQAVEADVESGDFDAANDLLDAADDNDLSESDVVERAGEELLSAEISDLFDGGLDGPDDF